jgi:hypothetical protein
MSVREVTFFPSFIYNSAKRTVAKKVTVSLDAQLASLINKLGMARARKENSETTGQRSTELFL